MLHSALLGRPVIAKPAVFHSNTARRVTVFARERPMIYYPNSEPPAHLDGSTPGDFGWDPFVLVIYDCSEQGSEASRGIPAGSTL